MNISSSLACSSSSYPPINCLKLLRISLRAALWLSLIVILSLIVTDCYYGPIGYARQIMHDSMYLPESSEKGSASRTSTNSPTGIAVSRSSGLPSQFSRWKQASSNVKWWALNLYLRKVLTRDNSYSLGLPICPLISLLSRLPPFLFYATASNSLVSSATRCCSCLQFQQF